MFGDIVSAEQRRPGRLWWRRGGAWSPTQAQDAAGTQPDRGAAASQGVLSVSGFPGSSGCTWTTALQP